MKISYNWLNEYLNLDFSIDELSDLLTDIGLEVEGVENIQSIKGGLEGVVVGKVLTKVKHPNADRLNLTTVDIGSKDPLQIVCGAPNVDKDLYVMVATVGTTLYTNEDSFQIKKSKIRGEVSEGMICSENELNIGEDQAGIMVLKDSPKPGTLAKDYLEIESDFIFDIGLTPNRSDAMSHIGVVKDLKTAINHRQNKKLKLCLPLVENFKVDNNNHDIEIEVKDYDLCPRYSGVCISGVKVKESPEWLKNRLNSIGVGPINNIVDITNYVLHELGQPLHAFDISKIKGNKIKVGCIKQDTSFITLDNEEIKISSDDLMISNANEPMCLAGVFGGIKSSITTDTVDVFLESAYFNPSSIRKSSKRHGLNTDASFRYERGCDPNIVIYALKRASLMIQDLAGGVISSDIVDIYPDPIINCQTSLSLEKMNKLIGQKIDKNIVISILKDLEIDILNDENNTLLLSIPPYRHDVKRDVDVTEEVLRIYGYNNIDLPEKFHSTIIDSDNSREIIYNKVSDFLSNNGFYEAMNNSLTKSEHSDLVEEIKDDEHVYVLNPLSKDLNVLRQSLLFQGLENIAYNQNRKNSDLKFYEFGKTYQKKNDKYIENNHLQLLVTGRIDEENWNKSNEKVSFFFIKEKVEQILNKLGIFKYKTIEEKGWGRSYTLTYKLKGKNLVCFGKIEKDLCKKFNIKSDVYSAYFNWDEIISVSSKNTVKYTDLSKFPEVRRDLSLLIDKSVSFDQLKELAFNCNIEFLRSVNLFDVYEGDKLPEGKKSYALSFIISDYNATLTDKVVDDIMNKLIKKYSKDLNAEIRQ